jgi:hypothetical protein
VEPVEFKPADLEAHISSGKLARLFKALKAKYKDDADPAGRAKIDIGRLLSSAFTKVGDHFEGVKAASVKRLLALQQEALTFYQAVLKNKEPPNVNKLKDILRKMDKEFRAIAKDTTSLIDEHPPVTEEVTIDPKTGRRTIKLDGGAEQGGATFSSGGAEDKTGEVAVQGPHPNRPKGSLEKPAGMRPGEHIGHGVGEGAVDNPNLVNRLENTESETAHSNLSPKKRLDYLVAKTAAAFFDHLVTQTFERHTSGNDPRPYATTYEIKVDGFTLYKITIPND